MNQPEQKTLSDILSPVSKELSLFEDAYRQQFASELQFLQPILDYACQEGGKRLRPAVFFLAQGLLQQPNPESVNIAVLLELLHTATLLHDDVVDESTERRGQKALHMIWGNQASVLVGDLMFAKVLNLGVDAPWPGVLKTIARVVKEMGQSELYQALTSPADVGAEEYFRTIRGKTAGLFSACTELGGKVAEAAEPEVIKLERMGSLFGLAFQIRDDILDFIGHTGTLGKPVGQDISNGKVTLPLILAVEKGSRVEKDSVFKKLEDCNQDDLVWLREYVEEKNGINDAQEKAGKFADEASEILIEFDESEFRVGFHDLIHHDLTRMR